MVTVEQLYKDFGVLADAKDKAGEHETEYLSILSGVKGGASEKRLACQFIPRFFNHFPGVSAQAIEAVLDLCEDDDIAIRKQAIKVLPTFCKDSPEHLSRISDILCQLLQSEDVGEIGIVQSGLVTLFTIDATGTLKGLFSQIEQGEDIVREHAIKFLAAKVKTLDEDVLTKDVEDFLVEESKKVLEDVTGDEFVAFMKILSVLKSMSTLQGRQQLVDIIVEQADLDKEFEASDPDCVDRLIQCVKQAMPLFSKNVQSSKFVCYLCEHVLPVLHEVSNVEEAAGADTESDTKTNDVQLEILKLLAEMSHYTGDVENPEDKISKVFDKLLEYMPLPPSEEENGENDKPNEEPKLQFSYVECLMYTFHQLGPKAPQFLTDENNADVLKDFRIRLQYFARGVQVYIKQLRAALQGKTGDALKTDENKIKVVALKITNNINTLIKDLFHNPPSYKAVVTVSWKPITKSPQNAAAATSPGTKRTPITFDGPSKKVSRQDKKIYSPPTGKWSETAGTFQGVRGGRGRGFRGGFGRGRGRGRGWRGGYNRW